MSQNLKEPLHQNVLPFSGLDLHCFSDFQVPLTWQKSTNSLPEICHRPGDMLDNFNCLVSLLENNIEAFKYSLLGHAGNIWKLHVVPHNSLLSWLRQSIFSVWMTVPSWSIGHCRTSILRELNCFDPNRFTPLVVIAHMALNNFRPLRTYVPSWR